MRQSRWNWEGFFLAVAIFFSVLMAARNAFYYFTAVVLPIWMVLLFSLLCAYVLLRGMRRKREQEQ